MDKAYFQYDMAYEDFKDLNGRASADKVLHDKEFNIAINPKCDGYQRGIASIVYFFLTKKLQVLLLKNAKLCKMKS